MLAKKFVFQEPSTLKEIIKCCIRGITTLIFKGAKIMRKF